MSEQKDKNNKRIFYSMSEVAEMFDVNQSLIRYWESQFDILRPTKNKKGNRMFTPSDIEDFRLVYYLVREKGMTLKGAQQRIKDNKDGLNYDIEIIERLQTIRALLVEVREELKMSEDDIVMELDRDEIVPKLARSPEPKTAMNAGKSSSSQKEVGRDDKSISFELHMEEESKDVADEVRDVSEEEEGSADDNWESVQSEESEIELDGVEKQADETDEAENIYAADTTSSVPDASVSIVENSADGDKSAALDPAQKSKSRQLSFTMDEGLPEPMEMLMEEGIASDREYMEELQRELFESGESAAEVSETLTVFDEESEMSDEDKAFIYDQSLF